ncbi:hypothetical protein [Cupriavidus nantongensis]|uniref:hypothetical protein n=1 Tax=Cupriavidus nantongensis TaxID=1796606 RepID=UPI0012374CEE|nr:hypothetical protein [Cupriavidus nantongensis]
MFNDIERFMRIVGQQISRDRRRYEARVESVFDLVLTVLPATAADSAWLRDVKHSALQGKLEWKLKLASYLQGIAGKAERQEAVALVQHAVDECPEKGVPFAHIAMPMLWALMISVATMSNVVLTWGASPFWILLPLVVVVAGATARNMPWLNRAMFFRLGRLERTVSIGVYGTFLGVMAVYFIPWTTSLVMPALSQGRFQQERIRLNDDPQGFATLRAFARDNFAVEVVLGDVLSGGWAETELSIPSGGSPASMSLASGYCEMNMNPARVQREFGPSQKIDAPLWTRGVMMHEFGHCLDTRRDLPGFNGRPPATFALAPIDANGVVDARTYIAAGRKRSTMLWREAFSDIFAVGYWRLSTSSEHAARLTQMLRAKRAENAALDKAHATMCWIDQAAQAALPGSYKDLVSWADQIRSSKSCSTQAA